MLILKLFVLTVVLSGPLLLNVSSKRTGGKTKPKKRCNSTEKCQGVVCSPTQNVPNPTCTYADYKNEYCECCKSCAYPPPPTVTCPQKTRKNPKPCPLVVLSTCTNDQYIKELCKPCPKCPGATTQPPVLDPCFSSPCPAGQSCVNAAKECFTTPCDQFMCIPRNPCDTIKCSAGFRCVNSQECKGIQCGTVGRCVPDPSQGVGINICPPIPPNGISICQFTNCSATGCTDGQLCCPTACGGTLCQTPVHPGQKFV